MRNVSGFRKNPCSNLYIYTFNYLDEDFIDFSLNEEWDLVNADISLHLLILLRGKNCLESGRIHVRIYIHLAI